jgi:hypothetical protein
MNAITRRRFIATAAMSVALTRLRAQGTAQVTLQIPTEANGPHMPMDYVGCRMRCSSSWTRLSSRARMQG